ncbi:MAG: aspartate-semialdehyde dehydrogenase [Pelagibacteraceae bacterium TMED216]|nr:MAG: aspartate-semialdehyde dehydrogenase [Pelagibacteraceae bacterium TMED216]|tara:strand:+ start:890 stop:1891 length:1002 start_codon:yes stop_codon:yes gene_type:complete
MNYAIIGATGNVGRKTIEILDKSKLKVNTLYLLASKKSKGITLNFRGEKIIVEDLDKYNFSNANITFFAAGTKIAEKLAMEASKKTCVIDNSKFFRMDKKVPLVIAEVNPDDLKKHNNLIANPNCSTIQLVLALKPLHDIYKVKRVIVSTYQAVSGAGKSSMDELFSQTAEVLKGKNVISKNFTKQIAFNIIPHIDSFVDGGYTKEEWKMENETKKILDKNINLSATCVRVPVKTSHSESVNIEFEKDFNLKDITSILSKASGCQVIDERKDGGYITPVEAEGNFKTFISRIRNDNSNKRALNMWVVSDNLLKGAALNTVQIAEVLVQKKLVR